jgi:N-acetylneuraminic acid mutarotase
MRWEKLPPLPDREGFAGSFAGVSAGALIIAGGANIIGDKWSEKFEKKWYDTAFVLEQPDRQWRTGFKLPRPLGYGASVTTPEGVICMGGSDAHRHYAEVICLEWHAGKLLARSLPDLPRPCANFCAALVDNTVFVASGIQEPDATTALKTFWKLDLAAGTRHWEELEPWPGAERMLAVAAGADGSFYLFGGAKLRAGPDGKPVRDYLRDAYRFTPRSGWEHLPDLPRASVAAPSPAPVADQTVFLFSGDDGARVDFKPLSQHPGFPKDLLAFDLRSLHWSVAGEVPFSRATAPTAMWRGYVVVAGGEVRPRERTPDVWWTKLQPK